MSYYSCKSKFVFYVENLEEDLEKLKDFGERLKLYTSEKGPNVNDAFWITGLGNVLAGFGYKYWMRYTYGEITHIELKGHRKGIRCLNNHLSEFINKAKALDE